MTLAACDATHAWLHVPRMALLDGLGADARAFDDLTDAQNQAIVDGLMLVALADGPATDGQATVLAGLIAELPTMAARSEHDREAYARASLRRLEALAGIEGVAAYVAALADALPSQTVRAVLLVMGASLGRGDGAPSPGQQHILGMMAETFGVDDAAFTDAVERLAAGVLPPPLERVAPRP